MQNFGKFNPKVSQLFGWVATCLLLLAVACGAAGKPAAAPKGSPQAPVAQAATPVPAATAAPTPTLAAAPKVHPGKVTLLIGSFSAERFDYTFNSGGHDYGRQIHAFLIESDVKQGRRVLVPGIATEWEISSDGLTWDLTIRKGVKFHDGTEVTAEDVLWSFRHHHGPQAPKYGGSSSILLGSIMDRIELTGPDRVSVTTKVPYAGYPIDISAATTLWISVYPKRATLHDLQEEAAYDRNPIGAGIMRLVKHVPVSSMTFERFADYYYQPKNGFPTDKRPNFTVLDLRLVPEEATRIAALRAGDADIAPVSLGARKQVEAGGGRLVFGPEGASLEIRQNGCFKPQFPCHDHRVRQALNYAIDKKIMQNQLYGGPEVMQLKGGWVGITPSSIGYSPELEPYPFDPVKARHLLADAGYPGGKGFGKLVIHTFVSAFTPLQPEAAQLSAEFWRRELGLDVEVKVGDEAGVQKVNSQTEEFYGQMVLRDKAARMDVTAVFRGRYGTPDRKDRAHNDPELFALIDQTTAVFDPVEKEKIYNSTAQRLRDEAYDINLGYLNIPWGVGPRIVTWQPYPLSNYFSALHTITLK